MGGFLVGLGRRLGEARVGPLDGAIAFVALYFLFQVLALSLASHLAGTGAAIDDAEQLLYLPDFWMGYGSSQPPLYSWINAICAHILGPTILSLKIVKYLMLLLTATSVAAMVRLFGYPRPAVAASALGLLLIPQILWEAQHTLSHSVAALAFSAMMALALVRIFQKRSLARYAVFGLAAGLALLAKYNDIVFLSALIAAALSMPAYRTAILDRRVLLSAGLTMLIVLPTAIWSLEHKEALLGHVSRLHIDQADGSMLPIWLTGLRAMALSCLAFSILPVGLTVLALMVEKAGAVAWRTEIRPGAQFVGRAMLFALAITAALVAASGTTAVPDRWLLPFLFLLPAYAAMCVEDIGPKGRKIQYFLAGSGAALAIAVIPGIFYMQVTGGKRLSRPARLDYTAFHHMLTTDGPVSTIVGDGHWVGNFRLAEPKLIILNPQIPHFNALIAPPAIVVWLDDRPMPKGLLNRVERAGYAVDGAVHRLSVPEHMSEKGSRDANFVRLRKIRDLSATPPDVPDPAPDGD